MLLIQAIKSALVGQAMWSCHERPWETMGKGFNSPQILPDLPVRLEIVLLLFCHKTNQANKNK